MKRQMIGFTCGALAVLAMASSAWAKTVTWTVAAGETKTFTDMVNGGEDVVAGDTIIKKGPGVLKVDSAYKIKCTVTVEEGVFHVAGLKMGNGGTVTVKKGACLYLSGTVKQMLESWTYNVAGEGTGVDPYLGAIVVNGNNGNGQMLFGTFNLTDDATFYTCKGTLNNMFSGTRASSGPVLKMNAHTLTLKGPDASAKFRARWALKINDSGPFVVDGLVYSRHANSASTMDAYTPNIPEMKMVNGAIVSLDGYYFQKVNQFDCAAGTSFGYSSAGTPKLGADGAFKGTVKKVIGCPSVLSDTVLTISESYVARGGDLAEGKIITSDTNALTFGSGCTIKIEDVYAYTWTKGTPVTIARAASIDGEPTIDPSQTELFTLTKTETELKVTPSFDIVTLASWGVKPGEENAEANAQVFAVHAASVAEGTQLLFTEAGDFYFGDMFDLSVVTAAKVTLKKLDSVADDVVIHSTIKIGAAKKLTVEGLTVKGLDGPMVIASGTQGLVLKDLTADAVVGSYGDPVDEGEEAVQKKYPFVMNGVTDLEVVGFSSVNNGENMWDDLCLFSGEGSQSEASVVRDGEIVLVALKGKSSESNSSWYHMSMVKRDLNLVDAAWANKKVVITGDGATVDGDVKLSELGVKGVIVKKGQYVARSDAALGVAKAPVEVKDGGALCLANDGQSINSRTVKFEGDGLGGVYPAIRFTGTAVWNKAQSITYELTGDATMYNNSTGENGTFLYSTIKMNGHKLTLKGTAKSNYRFGRTCLWSGGGEVVVASGVAVSAATKESNGYRVESDAALPTFTFEGTSKFLPDSADIFNLIKNATFANAAALSTKSGKTNVAATFDTLQGAPSVGDGIAKVTVNTTYLANKADLVAGKALTLSKPLTFTDGATVTLDDLTAYEKPVKTLIATASSIIGKPKPDAAAEAAGWRVAKETNADGTVSLYLGPISGLTIFVR